MNCYFSVFNAVAYMEEQLPDRPLVARLFVLDYTSCVHMETGLNKLLVPDDNDPYESKFSQLQLPNALIREYDYNLFSFSQEFEFVYPGVADFYYLRFQYWKDSMHSRWSRAERMTKGGTVWNTAQHHGYWHPGMLLDMSWRGLTELTDDTTRSNTEQRRSV